MAKSEYKEARRSSAGKKLSHLEVKMAANGGHVVTHHYHTDPGSYEYHKPEEHVFGEDEGNMAMSHIAKHAKINETGRAGKDEGEEEEEG